MNSFLKILLALYLPGSIIINSAYANDLIEAVKLPAERSSALVVKQKHNDCLGTSATQFFSNDETIVLRDPSTGCARRVIGSAEKIKGFDRISVENVDKAARAFLRSKEKELGLADVELKLRRATHVNDRWYVTYGQIYKGLDVLLTEVELRIFDNGNVAMYGADIIRDLNLDVNPKLSSASVNMKLQKEIEGKANVDKLQSSETIFALPIKTGSGVVCRLVRRNELIANDGSRFINYSDANNGSTVWRFEKTKHVTSEIEVTGLIKDNKATDTVRRAKFSEFQLRVGDKEYMTDSDGKIRLDLTVETPFTATLSGPNVKVIKKNHGKSALIADTLRPGEKYALDWNAKNSHAYERAAFYHANFIHADMKSIDPDMNYMDYQMVVVIDFAGSYPNAYSNGADTIVYFCASSSTTNMPESASILYHEYTHAINDQMYANLGSMDGMINFSTNEAMADLYPCLIQREPQIGKGAFKADSNKYIRCIENNYTYPEDITTESHHNGQILSGAFWDLAKATSFDFVKKLSHFTKYGLPDDPNVGVAFSEWFLETLVADDDDGDLSNGTPHFSEIVTAFNKHHIGTDLLLLNSFEFVPLSDTQDTLNAIPVEFRLKAPPVAGAGIEKVKVVYTVDNGNTINELEAVQTSPGNYEAKIPPQPEGAFVSYFIVAQDISSGRDINLIKSSFMENFLSFTVGFKTALLNECESSDGWKFGDTSDYESYGIWECASPNEVDLSVLSDGSFGLLQIGYDHSPKGDKCFVTDAAGPNLKEPIKYVMHMAVGKRTLYSPAFSIENFKKPIIKFWRFTTLSKYANPEDEPTFCVFVSGDEGANWILAANYKNSTQGWKSELINLSALIPGAKSIKFKFVAQNDVEKTAKTFNHCEALIDDIEFLDLSSALSADDAIDNTNSITLYPNPTADFIYLPANVTGNAIVYDVFGNSLKSEEMIGGGEPINVAAFPSGVYFLKLISSNGEIRLARFIKS